MENFAFLDSLGEDNIEWSINLPEHVVEDTVDGKVTVNSDILGPMFQVNMQEWYFSGLDRGFWIKIPQDLHWRSLFIFYLLHFCQFS